MKLQEKTLPKGSVEEKQRNSVRTGRLIRCVEVARNRYPRKEAWKCGRKMSLERKHERAMHVRSTGKMCMDRMQRRKHGRGVKKGCAEGAIKGSFGMAQINRTRDEVCVNCYV